MSRRLSRLVLCAALLAPLRASAGPPMERPEREPPPRAAPPAPAPEPRSRPFESGSMNLGLALGLSSGEGTAFSLGAGFGYFVLPGLEPGLELEVTLGSDRPTVTSLLPYLRWVFWRSYTLSPYLKVQGGRWFISGQEDLSAVGGGGGLVFFLTRSAGLQLEALVLRLFPQDACGDSCTTTSVGFSLGLYFGNPPPVPPRSPPSPPAAGDEPSPEGTPRDEPVPF